MMWKDSKERFGEDSVNGALLSWKYLNWIWVHFASRWIILGSRKRYIILDGTIDHFNENIIIRLHDPTESSEY